MRDACRIVAQVNLDVMGPIQDIEDLFERAESSAKGLWGAFYEAGSEGQKWEWIDMCEEAFRKEQESRLLNGAQSY